MARDYPIGRLSPLLMTLLLVACGAQSGGNAPAGNDGATEVAEVGTEAAAESSAADAAGGDPGASATSASGDASGEGSAAAAGTSAPGTVADGVADGATPDPTQMAVAAAFSFPIKGPAGAPLTIYTFSDYRCPYCRRFATETLPRIEEEFMGPGGQVQVAYIDFPLSSHGLPAVIAAEGAHCAGEQDRYWEMHDAVFGSFAEMNDLPLDDEQASLDYVAELGAGIVDDPGALRQCLETQRYRPTIGALFRDAVDAQIEVTPTLVVGEEIVLGFVEFDELRPVIERQIALALGTPVAPPPPTDSAPPESSSAATPTDAAE